MKVKLGSVLKKISNYILVPRWIPKGKSETKRTSLQQDDMVVAFEDESPRPSPHSSVVLKIDIEKEAKSPSSIEPQPISPFQSRLFRQRAMERRKSLSSLDVNISSRIRLTNQVKIERDSDGWKFVNEYKVVKILGYGSQGNVKLVEKNTESYAMKTIQRSLLRSSRRDLKLKRGGYGQFENELRNLHRIDHPNCINLLEVLNDEKLEKVYLIFEYANKGPLGRINPETGQVFRKHEELEYIRSTSPILDPEDESLPMWNPFEKVIQITSTQEPDLVEQPEMTDSPTPPTCPVPRCSSPPPPPLPHDDDLPLTERRCRRLFYDLVLAVRYLHKHQICHRDLKPSNLLVTEEDHLKVTDFGDSFFFGVEYGDRTNERRGTPEFTPPEYTFPDRRLVSGRAHDCWSLGCCLFVMAFGELPFYDEKSLLGLYEKIQNVDIRQQINRLLYSPPKRRKYDFVMEKQEIRVEMEEEEGESESESEEEVDFVDSPFLYYRTKLVHHPPPQKKISRCCVDLMIKLLEKDPLKRFSIDEVWVSEFVRQERILRNLKKRTLIRGHRRTKTLNIFGSLKKKKKKGVKEGTEEESKKSNRVITKSKSCSHLDILRAVPPVIITTLKFQE